MRSIRKLMFAALSALGLCLAVASGASADQLKDATTGAVIPVGDTNRAPARTPSGPWSRLAYP